MCLLQQCECLLGFLSFWQDSNERRIVYVGIYLKSGHPCTRRKTTQFN